MVKRNYIADIFKWIGFLGLVLYLHGGDALATSNNSSTAPKVTSAAKPASMLSKSPVSKVSNVELIYADGGVRVRVHTGALTEFSHQIEPPKNGRPYRIILDVLNSIHNLGGNQFSSLPNSVIRRIRTSQFAVKPQPITRIVLDLGKEAFYRVEQQPEYIDLFVTDRKAKRFNSWSSSRWLAARNAKAADKKAKSNVTLATESSPSKPKSESKLESPALAKIDAQVTKVASTKESGKKPSVGQGSHLNEKPVLAHTKTGAQLDKSQAVKAQPMIVATKPAMKKETKQVEKKSSKPSAKAKTTIAQAPTKKSASGKTTATSKTVPVKKPLTVAIKDDTHSSKKSELKKTSEPKHKSELKSNTKSAMSKGAVAQKTSVRTPVIATASSPKESAAKVSSPKKVVSKKVAPKKSVSQKSGSVTLASSKQSKSELSVKHQKKTQKQSVEVEKKSSALASAKPTAKSPAKLSNSKNAAKVSKSVKSKSDKGKTAQLAANPKPPVAKLASAKKQDAKASKATSKVAPKTVTKKKAAKSSSSLFATTANAATPGQQTYKDSESDRRYKAQFRRSIDQRKIKLKGAQVAEFPKRLTIKYKTHGTRDPFATLLAESSSNDDFLMKELPNVEALTMVGILRDVKGKTRGLFEDIDGRGYILSKGDKVHNGTVLKVTKQKAYFQIFEYGWSRTVALSLEG